MPSRSRNLSLHRLSLFVVLLTAASALADVSVTSPANGASVTSPVTFIGTATTKTCSKGVASMGVYVDNQLKFVVNGASLNTSLAISPGSHGTVMEEWDFCGGATYTKIPITVTSQGGVSVSSPANNSTVNSPVHYVATATTSTCSKGVASMGIYVDNQLTYVVNGSSMNTKLALNPGKYNTVVEEWDYCGGASYTPVAITVNGQSGVSVSSPANNSTVTSPVHYVASGSTSTCSKGVASMGIYVNNKLTFVSSGATLDTSLPLNPGSYGTVVEEWDYCGGAAYTPISITVSGGGGGNTLSNLQASKGWVGYGELPPDYNICSSCGPGITWSMTQGIKSPSMSGNATQFNIGGNKPYSDVLFTNPLIGDFSSQGLPDGNHTLIPTLHNFTYDLYFYSGNLQLSQVLEFDINQYFDNMGFTWGHQCRIAGGNEWDIWDNINAKWVPTGVACNPVSNSWNHLTLQVQRTSDNKLLFHSITLNGVTSVIDKYYSPFSVPGWYGVTVNFQMDGNSQQAPYSVYLDDFGFTYW